VIKTSTQISLTPFQTRPQKGVSLVSESEQNEFKFCVKFSVFEKCLPSEQDKGSGRKAYGNLFCHEIYLKPYALCPEPRGQKVKLG
jgi:hypothetical protein